MSGMEAGRGCVIDVWGKWSAWLRLWWKQDARKREREGGSGKGGDEKWLARESEGGGSNGDGDDAHNCGGRW